MRKDEFPIVDKAIEKAVLEERAKWKAKIMMLGAEIEARKMDCSVYEYAGAYSDGKLAAYDYCIAQIRKIFREGDT